MRRIRIEDRLDEIEVRLNGYSGTLDEDNTDMLWMITILRTLLDGRQIS